MPKTELEINWIHLFSVVLQILWGTRADLFSKLFALWMFLKNFTELLVGTHSSFQSVILKLPAHPFPSYRNTQTQILNKSYMHQFGVFYNVNTMTGPEQHMLTMGSRFFFSFRLIQYKEEWAKMGEREREWVRGKEEKWKSTRTLGEMAAKWREQCSATCVKSNVWIGGDILRACVIYFPRAAA